MESEESAREYGLREAPGDQTWTHNTPHLLAPLVMLPDRSDFEEVD